MGDQRFYHRAGRLPDRGAAARPGSRPGPWKARRRLAIIPGTRQSAGTGALMTDLEQLGAFYLGARVDETFARTDEPLLLDASDLATHAVIVGVTGGGKTGLVVALIEEAAIDCVPVPVVDPEGEMGNLDLTFPGLEGRDLEPWLDPRAAEREGTDLSTYAAKVAREWGDGLASWGEDAARVERLRR